jgi:hypothetical protein
MFLAMIYLLLLLAYLLELQERQSFVMSFRFNDNNNKYYGPGMDEVSEATLAQLSVFMLCKDSIAFCVELSGSNNNRQSTEILLLV